MRVEKELAEMHDGSVQLISLVETGANAAPFKRLKSEETEGGIDVFKAEQLKAKATQAPRLIALAVSPEGDVDAAKAIAKACDIEIQDEREVEGDDGTTTLLLTRKSDRVNTEDPAQIQIQLDEELTAVCRVEKQFIPFNGSTSFAEAIKAQGFFPQLHNALDVFHDVAWHILDSAESPGEASTKIQKSGDELVSLLALLTKALPKNTFKMAELIKTLKADEAKAEGEGTESLAAKEEGADEATAEGEGKEEGADEKVTVSKETEAAEKEAKEKADAEALAAKAEHDPEEDAKGKKAKKPKAKDTPSELDQVLKAIEALSETVATQGESQGKLKEQLEEVAAKAEEAKETATAAEKAANETDAAVTGRVSTTAAPDSRRAEERVQKGIPPLMDTGMQRVHARGGAN